MSSVSVKKYGTDPLPLRVLKCEIFTSGLIRRPDFVQGIRKMCLLEGMALALERRFEPFSRVEEIEAIAARHGIHLAPLYNAEGPIKDGTVVASQADAFVH